MPPELALEAPRLYTSTFYFSAREEVCAGIELHVGCSCYVYLFFFPSLLHQMLTSGNCPTPEKSLVLHQVIPKFHKRLTFQNTFLGSFCRKETTCWKNLLLTGGFKEQAKTSQTLSYCCNKSKTMEVLFVFNLWSITNLQGSERKVTFRLIFIGTRHRSL